MSKRNGILMYHSSWYEAVGALAKAEEAMHNTMRTLHKCDVIYGLVNGGYTATGLPLLLDCTYTHTNVNAQGRVEYVYFCEWDEQIDGEGENVKGDVFVWREGKTLKADY